MFPFFWIFVVLRTIINYYYYYYCYYVLITAIPSKVFSHMDSKLIYLVITINGLMW